MKKIRKPTYEEGIEFIALNDNPGDRDDVKDILGYFSVVMLSHLFGVNQHKVALDVWYWREAEDLK